MEPTSLTARRTVIIEVAAVVVIAVVLFFLRFGMRVLDPGQVDWLMARNDPASYFLVWDYFRYEDWSFPLGRITSYLYPLGTSVPLVDGLPIVAYPFKLLSPLLPPVFQYFGLWHLVCAVLQAYFGYRIVRRFVPHTAGRLLGAALFLLAPVFLNREGHIALSSHWVLLAAIDLYLRGTDGGRWRVIRRWCILAVVVGLIHPYLVAMVLLIFAGLVLRSGDRVVWPWRDRLLTAGAVAATLVVVWWIAGYLTGLSGDRAATSGFGHFSLNLNALINPMGYGTLLPDLPRTQGQYEGYAYLGAGWLLIAAAGLVALLIRRDVRAGVGPHRALVLILVLTFVYALSNVVMCNRVDILKYRMPAILDLLTGTFRCSGRFVWPVVYAGMTGLVFLISRLRWRWVAIAFMTVALVLQVWDIRPLILQKDHFAAMTFESRLTDSNWETAADAAAGITTVPPFKFTLVQKGDYREFCWLATRNRIPTMAGYTARMSLAARALSDSLSAALADGTADTTHLYVCDYQSYPEVLAGLDDRFRSAFWDGYPVIYPRHWPVADRPGYTAGPRVDLAQFLAERRDRTLLLAVRDEATTRLTEADRKALRNVGVAERDLAYRGSLAAIVHQGQTIWQRAAAKKRIEFSLAAGDSLGSFRAIHPIKIVSAGFDAGNAAHIRTAGQERTFNLRGLNIVVLDEQQRYVETAWFDTFIGASGVILVPTPGG